MKKNILLFLSLCGCIILSGQSRFDGLWEGELTYGGLASERSYRFQMWIKSNAAGSLWGRTYVYLSPEEVVEMQIEGRIYDDLSIYLVDKDFVPMAGREISPPFYRKYQLKFDRSIWETSLDGYWQQVIDAPMDIRRDRGRLKLIKVRTLKP